MEPGVSLPHTHNINYRATWLRSWQVEEAENKVVAECKYFAAQVGLLHHRKRNCDYWWRHIAHATAICRNPHSLTEFDYKHTIRQNVVSTTNCGWSAEDRSSFLSLYNFVSVGYGNLLFCERCRCCCSRRRRRRRYFSKKCISIVYNVANKYILFSVWPLCPRCCSLLV
jgi:hypothetical protein